MQWAVLIGRLDIATAVMSLSSFRAMSRRGYLKRAKQIYGYLWKMKQARIRVLTKMSQISLTTKIQNMTGLRLYMGM
jgi:hypothetical protein